MLRKHEYYNKHNVADRRHFKMMIVSSWRTHTEAHKKSLEQNPVHWYGKWASVSFCSAHNGHTKTLKGKALNGIILKCDEEMYSLHAVPIGKKKYIESQRHPPLFCVGEPSIFLFLHYVFWFLKRDRHAHSRKSGKHQIDWDGVSNCKINKDNRVFFPRFALICAREVFFLCFIYLNEERKNERNQWRNQMSITDCGRYEVM